MNKQTGFVGFPDKKMNRVVVPDFFFSDLLPQIDNLAELKLTLHAFWLLNEQSGDLRYLRGDDLRGDTTLLQSLVADDLRPALTILEDALERAVARNTLLRLEITVDGDIHQASDDLASDDLAGDDSIVFDDANGQADEDGPDNASGHHGSQTEMLIDDWYFMNTVKGRQTLALIRQGRLNEVVAALPDEARLKVDRPIIFKLYEQNVGIMSPMIAEQLKDLEKTYPPEWINESFEIAVSRNARNLKYITAILKRWEVDGRDDSGKNRGKGESHERHGRSAGQRRVSDGGDHIPDDFKDIVIG